MNFQPSVVIVLGSVGLLSALPTTFAQEAPCSACGPGEHWVDTCGSGQDVVTDHGALVGIDINFDCVADIDLVMSPCGASNLVITRTGPRDDSTNFPGLRTTDSHLDVVDTEIVSMCLTGGGLMLIAGAGQGQGAVLAQSLGAIAEKNDDPETADSFFDVFFEIDLGGGDYAYNQTPLRIQADINCVPPQAEYLHPTGCVGLYSSPIPGEGTHVANLVSAEHHVYIEAESACCVPGEECLLATQSLCKQRGGTIHPGSDCLATGACCKSDGTCVVLAEACCADLGGTYQGDGTSCEEVVSEDVTPSPPPPPCGHLGLMGVMVLPCTLLGWGLVLGRLRRGRRGRRSI